MKLIAAFALAIIMANPAFAIPPVHNWQDIERYRKEFTNLASFYTGRMSRHRLPEMFKLTANTTCLVEFIFDGIGEGTDTWSSVATGPCLTQKEEALASITIKVQVKNLPFRFEPFNQDKNINRRCNWTQAAMTGATTFTVVQVCDSGWKKYIMHGFITPLGKDAF